MHVLERCGFEREAEKWFKMIRPKFAIHVHTKQGGWGAGVARESKDFELTDVYYQADKTSPDVVWGKKTHPNPVAAALAAVQFILHFGFVECCDEELQALEELIQKESSNYVGEDLTDGEKRKQRVKEILGDNGDRRKK